MTETQDRRETDEADQVRELNERLNDLLCRWHVFSMSYSLGKGYPSTDVMCRQSKSPSIWDDRNGVVDVIVEKKIMEAVDSAIYSIPHPHQTALQFQARNLHTGRQVWTSPRLPTNPEERIVLTMEARNMLMRALAQRGVMS